MKKYIVLAVVVIAVIVGIVYRSSFAHKKVAVTEVKRGNLITVVYAIGSVSADSSATLRSEAGGIVTYVDAYAGMHVERGQVLLRTDDRQAKLRSGQAKLDVETAALNLQDKLQNLQRTQALFTSNSATQRSLDDAERSVELAKLNLEQQRIALDLAEERLSQTRLTAPFSGVIISSSAKLGDYLLPGSVAFQMIAPSSILVDAQVDEQDFGRIAVGQKCVVAFDAYGSQRFDGTVYRIVPQTNGATRTSQVFVKLADPPANLNVGMTATVNIISSELHDVMLVPRTAVIQLPQSDVVYTVRAGRVVEVKVKLGATEGELSEIIGGNLSPGTKVISQPGPEIRNGMRVEVAA